MLRPKVFIHIGDYLYKGCKSFTVSKSVDNLSDTGSIELPLRGTIDGEYSRTDALVKKGDAVRITAGYEESDINEVFVGYVSNVDPSDCLKITVEDAVYQLRKKSLLVDEKKISVKAICSQIITGTELTLHDDIINLEVDAFKYKGNAAGALAKLKESLKLTAYIDGDKLYVGGQQMNIKGEVNAIYGTNILKNSVQYQYADTNPVQVIVIGKSEDGTEVKELAGEAGGTSMTFYKYNVTDKELLQTIAQEELQRYSFDGFKGSLQMWFIPFAECSGVVAYENYNYPQEVKGRYFIKGVKYNFNASVGLKQVITLGGKL